MVSRKDYFSIMVVGYWFTIARYEESSWGKRSMRNRRLAIDLGYISFIFENFRNE